MHVKQKISVQTVHGKAATTAAPNVTAGQRSKSMAKSTDLYASDVPISAAITAAHLLVILGELNCVHGILNEKFEGLVVMHGLATDNEDWEGAQSALTDLEHFIMYPYSDD